MAGEAGAGDLGDEVLGHLVLADDLPSPLPDLRGVLEPPGSDGCRDLAQVLLGGSEQVLALSGPLGGQDRVVAADQPLAGVVRVLDLGEVVGAGQRHLQRAVVAGQGGDRGGAQRGDPLHAGQLAQVIDPGAGDHPAVPDHDQVLDAEVAADAGDGGLERDRVGGVPGEDLDRDRATLGAGEQPVLDLLPAALAVPGVPERGQLAAAAFHPGGGQVEHRDPARGQVPGRELLLDAALAAFQPVHRRIHLIGRRVGHAQVRADRGVPRRPPRHRGQLRLRPDRAGHDQRVRDIALAAGRAEQVPQPQLPGHHARRRRVAVRD